jgi:hypothetical protein
MNKQTGQSMSTQKSIDISALRTNQAAIIAFVLFGFVTNIALLPAFVAAVMIIGTFVKPLALFKQTYRLLLKPLGLVHAEIVSDDPAPHEFAQGFGGVVLGVGSLLLYTGATGLGWLLAWVVIVLAAANLFLGFCAGCFVYFQLARLGLPGFHPRLSHDENAA